MVLAPLALAAAQLSTPAAAADADCPRQLHRRSPEQVVEAHLAAFRSANAALLACDYANDALVMLPGMVVRGREAIESTFAGFLQAAGPVASVTVSSTTADGGTVLVTYAVESEHIVVPNGVDTFIVVNGKIVVQTGFLGGLSTR
jgi:predicted SnoaL-like aldol condensation-catalyzing enzyme